MCITTIVLLSVLLQLLLLATTRDKIPLLPCLRIVCRVDVHRPTCCKESHDVSLPHHRSVTTATVAIAPQIHIPHMLVGPYAQCAHGARLTGPVPRPLLVPGTVALTSAEERSTDSPERRCFREAGGGEGKVKRANMACRSFTSSSVGGARDMKVEGGSGTEDGASGQMSSSVCQGGIDMVSWVLVDGGGRVANGEASQSDSAAREMASRRFLRWRDAATAGEGNGGEEKDDEDEEEDEEEVEKSELEDMSVVPF